MINAQLSIIQATAASHAKLVAVGIQTDTLIQLGRMVAAGDDGSRRLIDALEALGKVADGAYIEGSLDEALGDVATEGRLDDAVMDLSDADVQQLAKQATAALDAGTGTVHHLPAQTRRAS